MSANQEEDFLEPALRAMWFLYREAVLANAARLADIFEETILALGRAAERGDRRPSVACVELLQQFHTVRIFKQMNAEERKAAVRTIEEIEAG